MNELHRIFLINSIITNIQSFKTKIIQLTILIFILQDVAAQPHRQSIIPHRCSNRLENALEHVRRRSLQIKTSRTHENETPYSLYYSFYGPNENNDDEEQFYNGGGGADSNNGRGYYSKNINRNTRRPTSNSYSNDLVNKIANTVGVGGVSGVSGGGGHTINRKAQKFSVSHVDVEDLKVRVPPTAAARWVEVDKCKFSTENSTLDTRLIFPDLTISGKIVMQPTGGKCNMILRLRHAGIEFRTIPIGFDTGNEQYSRGAASVRTDSHFAEPGFISVFAHGCQGPTGIKLRQNSKRRYGFAGEQSVTPFTPEIELSEPHVVVSGINSENSKRWGKFYNTFRQQNPFYDIRTDQNYKHKNLRDEELDFSSNEPNSAEFYDPNGDNFYRKQFHRYKRSVSRQTRYYNHQNKNYNINDQMKFNDDIFNMEGLQDLVQPDARAFADLFSGNGIGGVGGGAGNHEEVNEAFTNELEKLFSMGVRSLLTTYMQRALQPAIKETLMENMGYTLSYG